MKYIELEERKSLMIGILSEFIRFCEEYKLKYFITYGTLLGAVRHKGFIPWDDDMDIMMPIDDYNKLIELTKQGHISERYSISTPLSNPYHMWPMLKVCDDATILVEPVVARKRQCEQKQFYGVYIDIFPLYGLPCEEEEKNKFQNKLWKIYENYKKSIRVMNKRNNDSNLIYYIRCILYFIYCFPQKLKGYKYYLRKIENMINEYSLENVQDCACGVGIFQSEKDRFPVELFSEVIEYPFENLKCKSILNYDYWLKKVYGDYMKLPPVEKRKIHPSTAIWK